jgi:CYTH domain-containing protein
MGNEIERKFIVKNDNWKARSSGGVTIRQAYINDNTRVRISGSVVGLIHGYITVKHDSGNPLNRKEFEYEIPISDAIELFDIFKSRSIEKTRYMIPTKQYEYPILHMEGDLVWEVDVFKGNHEGLVLAEIELSNEAEEFEIPDWLGEEVTFNYAYTNSNLAKNC